MSKALSGKTGQSELLRDLHWAVEVIDQREVFDPPFDMARRIALYKS